MPEYRISVVVDPSKATTGGRQVETALSRMEGAAGKARSAVTELTDRLGKMASVAGVLYAAKQILDMSDAYGNLQNRLRQVTSSSAELASVNDRLFAIAQDTGSAFEDVGGTYARVRNSLSALGYSSNETMQFTESLTKALASAGKSGAETSSAMTQLGQALASGRLQGDEFRSITEAFPELLGIIAKQMGVSTTALKQLSSEGKISAKVLADSLIGAGDAIDTKFAKRIPTAAQAFQTFKNEMLRFVGEATQALGPMLMKGAEALGSLIEALRPLGGVITEVISKFNELAGSSYVDFFKEAAESVKNNVAMLGELAQSFGGLAGLVGDNKDMFKALFTPELLTGILQEVNATNSLADAVERVTDAKRMQAIVDGGNATAREALARYDAFRVKEQEHDQRRMNDSIKWLRHQTELTFAAAKKGASEAASAAKAYNAQLKATLDALFPIQAALAAQKLVASDLFALVDRGSISLDQAGDAMKRYTQAHRDALDPVGALRDSIAQERAGLFLTADALALEASERQHRNDLLSKGVDLQTASTEAARAALAQQEIARAKANRVDLLDLSKAPTEVSNDKISSTKQEILAARAAAGDFNASWSLSVAKLRADVLDTSSVVATALEGAFRGAEDAIVSFVTTGKMDFHSLTTSILADLTRILIRMGEVWAIKALFGGGGGIGGALAGFGTDTSPINYFGANAVGGSYRVGGSGGVDTTPVMFRATPGERVDILTPAQQAAQARAMSGQGNRGGAAPVVNVQTVAQIAPEQILDVLQTSAGRRVVFSMLADAPGALGRMRR